MMISFTIKGNQDDPERGNPIPYVRSTQRGQHKPHVRKYNQWKDYVRRNYILQCRAADCATLYKPKTPAQKLTEKPIVTSEKCGMDIQITFGSDRRGDPDNIWKGIADALFYDDKHLAGSFDFETIKGATPQVKIIIYKKNI